MMIPAEWKQIFDSPREVVQGEMEGFVLRCRELGVRVISFIISGPHGSGKTTLISGLKKSLACQSAECYDAVTVTESSFGKMVVKDLVESLARNTWEENFLRFVNSIPGFDFSTLGDFQSYLEEPCEQIQVKSFEEGLLLKRLLGDIGFADIWKSLETYEDFRGLCFVIGTCLGQLKLTKKAVLHGNDRLLFILQDRGPLDTIVLEGYARGSNQRILHSIIESMNSIVSWMYEGMLVNFPILYSTREEPDGIVKYPEILEVPLVLVAGADTTIAREESRKGHKGRHDLSSGQTLRALEGYYRESLGWTPLLFSVVSLQQRSIFDPVVIDTDVLDRPRDRSIIDHASLALQQRLFLLPACLRGEISWDSL
jgi:hypothetical protein